MSKFFEDFFFSHGFDPDTNVRVRTGVNPEIIAIATALMIILAIALG